MPTRSKEKRGISPIIDLINNGNKPALISFGSEPNASAESNNLPDPDVIARKIIEDLEAALEQFTRSQMTWVLNKGDTLNIGAEEMIVKFALALTLPLSTTQVLGAGSRGLR
jgi:hypothetical protein